MRIYTGLIKDLGCRCFYYDSGMNIPIGFVCAEIPDISSILSSKNGLSHFYEHMIIKRNDDISDKLFFDFNGYTDPRSLLFKGFTLPDVDINYHDAYMSFVRSRLNGVMDLYKSYDNISVDDVMDMIKDITENRLIIQYCSL